MDNESKEGYEKDKSDDDLLAEAKAFYQDDLNYENECRDSQREDLRFSVGLDHYKGSAYDSRREDNRPMLVVPRMDEFLNHVKNENRQNKPAIKVSPAGAQSEAIQKKRIKHAKNRQGLIRHIQYDSRASQAYQTAYDLAVDIGRGFFRISTEYVTANSFNQKIVIDSIPDGFSVVMDRTRTRVDYSDCQHGFVGERMPRERFKAKYPDADPANWDSQTTADCWMEKDDLQLMEYYCIRQRTRKLHKIEDDDGGDIENIFEDELIELDEEKQAEIRPRIIETRTVKEPYVKWYKMTSVQILETKDILGSYVPLIPMIGQECIVDGQLIIQGMVRKLKGSQQLYDFFSSTEAELLTLSPKSPYIAEASQIKGLEKYWKKANKIAHAVLTYKAKVTGGFLVPAPTRIAPPQASSGIVNQKQEIIEDMRAIVGMRAATLGATAGARSGRAIIAEQRTGDTSTFHYVDNEQIALTHAGIIINQWLPDIYDTARIEKILGEDDTESTIELGGRDGDDDIIELGYGDFDVVVTMGPAYATRRQEASESIMQFMQAVPNVVPLVYDLLVKNMDWPESQAIADRLRKTIPPQLLEDEGGEQKMAMQLQQLTAKVQEYEEMIPVLSQKMEQMMAELDDKGAEISKDLRIQQIKSATDITVANIRANQEEQKTFQKALSDISRKTETTPNT